MNVVHHSISEKSSDKEKVIVKNYFDWILRGGIISVVVLGFVYLMVLNSLATRGFALEGAKSERLSLQKQVEEVNIALAIPTSLYALQSSEQVQEMADVETKKFLTIRNDEVAFVKNVRLFY
ncbi:MAG: hypothetical protein OEL89_02630 [Candidatus Peregrinibacteria bacterium]|nr:hypothetical protein [Candidatus Peregrinibacteria bacterium]